MNDDEMPETIGPFLDKFKDYPVSRIDPSSSLGFLKEWTTPVTEDNMEELTGPGADDSRSFGKRLSQQYHSLIPGKHEPAVKCVYLSIVTSSHRSAC